MRGIGGTALSLLLVLGACDSGDSTDSLVAPVAPARERPAGVLSWQPCGAIECATLEVPIDYDDPSQGTLSLGLNRARSSAAQGYRGVVLVNPGGPGASGKAYVAGSAAGLRALLPGFDFVGFDPRGIGDSEGLTCEIPSNAIQVLLAEGAAGYLREVARASDRCAQQVGPLFDNMGSNQVVADIDRMREALGEEEINFIGISYGTRLGELYALEYPEHTRALVLDGPMTPVPDVQRQTESQFEALLELHQSFFDDCDAGVLNCPARPEAVFQDLLENDERPPLLQFAVANWKFLLVSVPGRELAALSLRVQAGEAPPEVPAGMAAEEDVVPTVNAAANLSTNCADDTGRPLSIAAANELLASYAERAPVFRLEGAPALTCSAWDVRRDPVPSLEFEPRVPPLVIGGTRDLLTPYELAQETVRAIEGAALLTSEHYGHSALGLGSVPCVFGHVRRYLETLQLPPAGARCAAPAAQ